MSIRLTVEQEKIVGAPLAQKIFLRGAYGTGKTTCGVRRMRHLIESGVPAHSILVVTPQRRLAQPYLAEQRNPRRKGRKAGADVSIVTLSGLAHQALKLFWPLIAEPLKLEPPFRPPLFLSLELVQYLMFKVVDPVIESRDFFNSVKISRPRLFSQLADNLNKSALVGFPHEQIAERLRAALPGDEERLHIFEDAQTCANLFRSYCATHNLMDFSRLAEVFHTHLWPHEITRNYFTRRYQHVIADHLEEDSPITHDLLRAWLPQCQSALLISDDEAGYRRFLGADEKSAQALADVCDTHFTLTKPRVMKADVQALQSELRAVMDDEALATDDQRTAHAAQALELTPVSHSRFHTQMLDWMCDHVARLVHEAEVKPSQIVILAPLLGDALRFALVERLDRRNVPTYTLRPSRPLHSEPAVRALMTLAKLAHPNWELASSQEVKRFDIIQMLLGVLHELDLARATLLAAELFKQNQLLPFATITRPEMRTRITEVFGERYDRLVAWLDKQRSEPPIAETIDVFFSRLFGEILSQKGFGFHRDFDAARIIANLIDSARSFRQTLQRIAPSHKDDETTDVSFEYVRMVDAGILAEQYEPDEWRRRPEAVLIAPAYTFLLSNQPVDYQCWLNLDSPAWTRRLHQPLTQPYVLSRQWQPGEIWTDAHERITSADMLSRVMMGLLRRCRRKVLVGFSKFDEQGADKQGELRMIFDLLMRNLDVGQPVRLPQT